MTDPPIPRVLAYDLVRLIRDACTSLPLSDGPVGSKAAHILADLVLGGHWTTDEQQRWALEFARKYDAGRTAIEEPTP